jgi:hypothetical protein
LKLPNTWDRCRQNNNVETGVGDSLGHRVGFPIETYTLCAARIETIPQVCHRSTCGRVADNVGNNLCDNEEPKKVDPHAKARSVGGEKSAIEKQYGQLRDGNGHYPKEFTHEGSLDSQFMSIQFQSQVGIGKWEPLRPA